jgi:hypothetical protein
MIGPGPRDEPEASVMITIHGEAAVALAAIAARKNCAPEQLGIEIVTDRLEQERKRDLPMAAFDHLAGQWPDKSGGDDAAFHDAIWPEEWRTDHLSTTLRGAAYLDALLARIVNSALANPDALKVTGKPFNEKAKLARALGLIDQGLFESLRIVSRIRNGFAHEIGRKLSHREVGELCESLSGRAHELMSGIAGGALKSPQRFRHALKSLKLALEEIADPNTTRSYPWLAMPAGQLPAVTGVEEERV